MLKHISKLTLTFCAAAALAACSQLPTDSQTEDTGSSDGANVTGGTGFTGGKSQRADGVPESAMVSLLGLWRADCGSEGKSTNQSSQGMSQTIPEENGSIDTPPADQEPPLSLQEETGDVGAEDPAVGQEGDSGKEGSGSSLMEIRFTREGAVHHEVKYMAEGCGDADKMMEMTMHFDYKVGQEVKDIAGARDIDLKLVGGEMALVSDQIIDMANGASLCGKSDWEAGVPVSIKDIDFAMCDIGGESDTAGDQDSPADSQTPALSLLQSSQQGEGKGGDPYMPKIGMSIMEIYKIDGDELFMSAGESDPNIRPTELDMELPYTKVKE
jgi:hypothetical protein